VSGSPQDIPSLIRAAGVVGAGGAGFPTHVKAEAKADVVIANGAECEPLLHKDRELLLRRTDEVIAGIQLMMRATGAKEGVLGVKAKHEDIVALYSAKLEGGPIRLVTMGDYYPAGDEYCLVYEATGRLIPPGGIPIQVGAVVNNVETLCNAAAAAGGAPVVDTVFTVAGRVKRPVSVSVPVGITKGEAIALAGGAIDADFAILDGGAMMGAVTDDVSQPVTKTTGGLIVLPKSHPLIRKKSAPRDVYSRIGRSACDQCSFCTEFCPRYLLGYSIEPHKVMRSLSFTGAGNKLWSEWALLCCECSLCSLYACPEELDPRNVCVSAKGDLREEGVGWKEASLNTGKAPSVHPVREYRQVPIKRLTKKLGLDGLDAEAELLDTPLTPRKVRIPLQQHLGAPARPVVAAGDKVSRGQLIGEIPEGKLGARVHASIGGTVRAVDRSVTIEA